MNSNDQLHILSGSSDKKRDFDQSQNRDMDYLFFKVFNNIYLRKTIKSHLDIYNNVYFNQSQHTVKSLCNFNKRIYLTTLDIIKEKTTTAATTTTTIPAIEAPPTIEETESTTAINNYKLPANAIPSSVVHLRLKTFIELCEADFPFNLKNLHFTKQFKGSINANLIPSGITRLTLDYNTKLIIPDNFSKQFNSLEVLKISRYSFQLLNYQDSLRNLKTLNVTNIPINIDIRIPPSIKEIVFGKSFHKQLPIIFPANIISISIRSYNFKKTVNLNVFPLGLTYLSILSKYHKYELSEFKMFKNLERLCYLPKDELECLKLTSIIFDWYPNIKYIQTGIVAINLKVVKKINK